MARSIATIQNELISNIQADSVLSVNLTSTSKRAIWNLWTYVLAVSINILEQLMDVFKTNTEATVALSAPNTALWLQNQIFLFQYSASNPQIIQLINLVPSYPVVDSTLRIISRCSVKTTIANQVNIKVATGTTPAALTSGQLSALQSYVNQIGVVGVTYNAISGNADQLYIQAQIYYQGAYSAIIQANVISAINTFLANLPFDGSVKVSDIELTIKSVSGVNDVQFVNVAARNDGTPFSGAIYLVQNYTNASRLWNTVSGYIIPETTTGQTLADSLTFIAE